MSTADILTKDEVADMLDCEPVTVEDKARSGELPAVKIGRSWLFPREALMQRLNQMALSGDHKKLRKQPLATESTAKVSKRLPPPLPAL